MVLGIDFGTSNSAAAIVQLDGRVCPIPLDGASASMPTALFFSSEDGHGDPVEYGNAALQAYLQGTQGRLMRSIKSLLGSRLMDEQTLVNGQPTSLFDIVVLFFKELKARSETFLGYPVRAAMLGRPVHFVDDDDARDALAQATLERAARAAGFEAVRFQLEPIAAAFDFERRVTTDTTVLVVDIGGGTSDFTVLRVGPQRLSRADRSQDILASTGTHIGGTDFDYLLNLRHVMPLLGLGHVGPGGREVPSSVFFNLSTWHLIHPLYSRKSLHAARELKSAFADPALHSRLMRVLNHHEGHRILSHVEAAKIACSSLSAPAEIDLACIERGLAALLSPAGLSQVLQQQVARIVECARQCVAASGVREVNAVYLTGGSSALAPLGTALQAVFSSASIVRGDRFGSVAAGLATSGWVSRKEFGRLQT